MSELFDEYEGPPYSELAESEQQRWDLSHEIRWNINRWCAAYGSAKSICIEGAATDQETGAEIKGAIWMLRMSNQCIITFLELDPETNELLADRFMFGIDSMGRPQENPPTPALTLAKVAAITRPENARLIPNERWQRLKTGWGQTSEHLDRT